jgi:uncharacterized DUF497 family protein
MEIQLEWDENKNTANIKNHDIDFCDAWLIFQNSILRKRDTRKNYGEERWVVLGKLRQLIVVVVYTYRSEKIRIISIRRANRHERKIYETSC